MKVTNEKGETIALLKLDDSESLALLSEEAARAARRTTGEMAESFNNISTSCQALAEIMRCAKTTMKNMQAVELCHQEILHRK